MPAEDISADFFPDVTRITSTDHTITPRLKHRHIYAIFRGSSARPGSAFRAAQAMQLSKPFIAFVGIKEKKRGGLVKGRLV